MSDDIAPRESGDTISRDDDITAVDLFGSIAHGEPSTDQALFELLAHAGWVEPDLGQELRRMAGFRNVLVHGHVTVDSVIVRDVLANRLQDLESFVASIRRRLDDVSTR